METIITENTNDLNDLGKYEVYFNEYDTGELRIFVDEPISLGVVAELQDKILAQGVVLTAPIVYDENGIIIIRFQKALAPLIIIGAALAAVGITGSVISWQLIKTKLSNVPGLIWALAIGSVFFLILSSEPAKKTAQFGKEMTKTYITRRVSEAPLTEPEYVSAAKMRRAMHREDMREARNKEREDLRSLGREIRRRERAEEKAVRKAMKAPKLLTQGKKQGQITEGR
jgi:hypothetical protein